MALDEPGIDLAADECRVRAQRLEQLGKEIAPADTIVIVASGETAAHADGLCEVLPLGARQLRGRFGLPVYEVDERYSTTEALQDGARDADAAAACIILEQFLRSLS